MVFINHSVLEKAKDMPIVKYLYKILIILLIVKSGDGRSTVFMVGDTDQAIYTSLGGVAKNINEIKNQIRHMEIIADIICQ